MSTSGQISSTLTVRDIIRTSMVLIGGPLENGEVSAEDGQLCAALLNGMLKSLQSQGCNLWRLSDESLTVPADTPTVTLDPRVLDVMEARYVGGVTYQRELARWEWGDYRSLPNKLTAGTPTCFSLNKQRTQIYMTFWPVNTEEMEILFSGARVIDDITDDLNQEADVPQEWLECVYFNLAKRMLIPYNIGSLSADVAARITATADQLLTNMLDFDRTGSVIMKPWGQPSWGYTS